MNNSELDLSHLKKCIDSLKGCTYDYKNAENSSMQGYIKDACVKRFEYTIETSWKIMKKYLKQVYGKTDKELTMNNIFRLMEGYGFIKSWEDWRNYYEKRNDTSHEYNEEKANKILDIIDDFVSNAEFLYQQLSKEIGE